MEIEVPSLKESTKTSISKDSQTFVSLILIPEARGHRVIIANISLYSDCSSNLRAQMGCRLFQPSDEFT